MPRGISNAARCSNSVPAERCARKRAPYARRSGLFNAHQESKKIHFLDGLKLKMIKFIEISKFSKTVHLTS